MFYWIAKLLFFSLKSKKWRDFCSYDLLRQEVCMSNLLCIFAPAKKEYEYLA